ncbi:DUF637 domain-containing protein [Halomonas sp. H5]|uniref:DUF637 domain-containing protein n=1 Tax=Halomonas sp. H5 TaxID=3423910 RepID=UPI003D36497E
MNHLGRVALPKWISLIRYFADQTYQGARLDLSAGRDIVNRAEIASQGDVAFLAGRNIVTEAVADARFAGQRAAQTAINAGVSTAIEGGSLSDNLEAGLDDVLTEVVSAVLFDAIGDYAHEQDWAEGGLEKVALHALVGGSVAEATGGDFNTGALAAGASEALVDRLVEDGYERQVLSNTVAQLVGIVAAELTGGDANEGAFIAGQVESYNRQLHPRERDLIAEQAATMEAQLGSPRLEDVTWSDMMALVSGAQLDAQQAARFDTLLAELDNTSNANNPLYQRFLEDLQTAQAAMGGLVARHQNESLSWADGQPITAHGEEVTAFQATEAQYRDGGLFGQVEAGTAGLGALGLFTQYGAGQASQHYGEVADIGASAPPMDEVYDRAYWNALGGGAESSTIDVDIGLALTGTGAGARAVSQGVRSWLQARVGARATTNASNFDGIVSNVPGQVMGRFDARRAGPLGNTPDSLAGTFSGGRYATVELTEPMILHRAWSPSQREFGGFWSMETPIGSLQSRIDSALLPEWGQVRGNPFRSQATDYTTVRVPQGMKVHVVKLVVKVELGLVVAARF